MIVETRRRLQEWGKWASGGYPSLGSMFRSLFGRGGHDGEMPAHIQEVDIIICRADPIDRAILIKFYVNAPKGSMRERARAMRMDRRTLKRKLDRAEWYVNSVLDAYVPNNVGFQQNAVFARHSHVTPRNAGFFTSGDDNAEG